MCRLSLLVPLAIALAACRGAAAPPALPVAGRAERVVLVSFDGLAGKRHAALLAAGAYRDGAGLAAFRGAGLVVEQAIPVNPTLTSPSHIAIATGVAPARSGIVGNRFHLPGTPITDTVSGFDHTIGAETLWEAVRRQGSRAGSLAYPGCNGPDERRRADFGMDYVQRPILPAGTVRLARPDFAVARETGPEGAPATAVLVLAPPAPPFPAGWRLALTAADTRRDSVAAYDTLLVDDDGDPATGVLAEARPGDWFAVRQTVPHRDGGTAVVGCWWLLRALAPDLAEVNVYRGECNATDAYPRAFREALDAGAGFWPGPPDGEALERGVRGEEGLTPGQYMEQVRRFSQFFTAAARLAIEREPFALLLAYQPIVDDVQHLATLTDPRQPAFSPGLAATCARLVDDTYRLVDGAVGEIARRLDLAKDALVVVSDHGIAPVWAAVHLNEALRRAGLCRLAEVNGKRTVAADSAVVAVASGGFGQVYVNLLGREPTGVVPAAELAETVRAAARALARVEVGGEPVVERLVDRAGLAALGLDHPNSGDLVVFLRPGFAATSEIGGPLSSPAGVAGVHGFCNTHAEMAGVWLARGAGVAPAHHRTAPLTAVAGYVSALLGLSPPGAAR